VIYLVLPGLDRKPAAGMGSFLSVKTLHLGGHSRPADKFMKAECLQE